jgi:hypothetical protein
MNEKLQELIKLSNENPELEIRVAVDSELYAGEEDYSWYLGRISAVEIVDIYTAEECIYLDEQIEDELEYEYSNNIEIPGGCEVEEYVSVRTAELKESGEIRKAIVIKIGV